MVFSVTTVDIGCVCTLSDLFSTWTIRSAPIHSGEANKVVTINIDKKLKKKKKKKKKKILDMIIKPLSSLYSLDIYSESLNLISVNKVNCISNATQFYQMKRKSSQ